MLREAQGGAAGVAGRQEHDRWPAFVLPWDDVTTGPTDMAGLLGKPAGADGFIRVVDGHLATGDGRRWRFWGVGQVFGAFFPPSESAGIVARRMAKFGINCVRIHHLDHRWPDGILKRLDTGKSGPGVVAGGHYPHPGQDSTRALDPEALARLDWFIACCKANGIYIDLNLNVSRQFSVGDEVRDAEQIGYGKGLTYFDERLITLQQEYARQLLDHVNPFTGVRYADEPAIAMIEIVNEQSLLEMWWHDRLRGEQTTPTRTTWTDIPPSYARDLDRRWNGWLADRYADRAALAAAWGGDLDTGEDAGHGTVRRLRREEFDGAAPGRFRDEAAFYAGIERGFFTAMTAFLRDEVGAKQLLVGTSDWNHQYSSLPALAGLAELDVIDGHAYWEASWTPLGPTSQVAQVDHPDQSLPALLSRSVVAGKPYIVSEINESFPNDYACEAIPIVAAYAALQDWDGIFWHSYTGGHFDFDHIWQEAAITHHLRICADPMKMAQMALAALLFLRGDVRAAEHTIGRHVPRDWALESTRLAQPEDGSGSPYWMPTLPGRLGLVHRTELADFDATELAPAPGAVTLPTGRIVSDTGELTWEETPGDGRVLIDAPRHQGIIGRAGSRRTTNLAVALASPFAAIQLASLDAAPIASAGRLLLLAAARVANTGMRWDAARRTVGVATGAAPTRIEPVRATLTLSGLVGATGIRLRPLDGRGQPFGPALYAAAHNGEITFTLDDDPGTLWYLIEIERPGANGSASHGSAGR